LVVPEDTLVDISLSPNDQSNISHVAVLEQDETVAPDSRPTILMTTSASPVSWSGEDMNDD